MKNKNNYINDPNNQKQQQQQQQHRHPKRRVKRNNNNGNGRGSAGNGDVAGNGSKEPSTHMTGMIINDNSNMVGNNNNFTNTNLESVKQHDLLFQQQQRLQMKHDSDNPAAAATIGTNGSTNNAKLSMPSHFINLQQDDEHNQQQKQKQQQQQQQKQDDDMYDDTEQHIAERLAAAALDDDDDVVDDINLNDIPVLKNPDVIILI